MTARIRFTAGRPLLDYDALPDEARMSEADFRKCHGADGPNGEIWVRRQISLDRRKSCHAAIEWSTDSWPGKYRRCRQTPMPGYAFCSNHGGPNSHQWKVSERERHEALMQARRREHREWKGQGLKLADELRRREIDRLHERALRETP